MKLDCATQTRSTSARWLLEEAGVDYEMEKIELRDHYLEDSVDYSREIGVKVTLDHVIPNPSWQAASNPFGIGVVPGLILVVLLLIVNFVLLSVWPEKS